MPDHSNPNAVEAAFYAAFQALDIQAVHKLWSRAPDVWCVHPGGQYLQGHEDVVASWRAIFGNAEPPQVDYQLINQVLQGDLAIHVVEEAIRPSGSDDQPSRVLATNIYRREGSGWRMLAHHASLPMMRRKQAAEEAPAQLH